MIKRKVISFILFASILTTSAISQTEQCRPTFRIVTSPGYFAEPFCDTLWNSNSCAFGGSVAKIH